MYYTRASVMINYMGECTVYRPGAHNLFLEEDIIIFISRDLSFLVSLNCWTLEITDNETLITPGLGRLRNVGVILRISDLDNYLDAHFNVYSTYLIRHNLRLIIYILALMLPFLAYRYLTEVSVGKSKSENYQTYKRASVAE